MGDPRGSLKTRKLKHPLSSITEGIRAISPLALPLFFVLDFLKLSGRNLPALGRVQRRLVGVGAWEAD